MPPTFWLLDNTTGWRTGAADGVAVGADLRLRADPAGPFGLAAEDGSLGGLVTPTGIAVSDDGICYLLDPGGTMIRRFDPARGTFVPVLGGPAPGPVSETTALVGVADIAITGRLLYIADRAARRVLVYGLPYLDLRHVWTGDWDLADVTSQGGATYLLDRAAARVWRHVPGHDDITPVLEDPDHSGRLSLVAVDRDGVIYLYDEDQRVLRRHDGDVTVVSDPAEVLSRFTPPPIRLVAGVFVLPEGLTRRCDRSAGPDRGGNAAEPAEVATTGPAFDRTGSPVPRPRPSRGLPPFVREGQWVSAALDSRIYRCEWDRVALDLAALPAGTSVRVATATFDSRPATMDDAEWTGAGELTGQAHAPGAPPGTERLDWPVRSRPGRYLAVRVTLNGPGRATPLLHAVRAHYPRQSYLEHLPAIFGADPDSKDFLSRFLGSFQAEWDDLDRRVARLPALADPRAVPAGPALRYLAGWLGIQLDLRWSEEEQRRWLLASLDVLRHRGTPAALRTLLAALMANTTGVPPDATGYPVLLEGFRARARFALGQPVWSTVDSPVPLWSPEVVGRLRAGSYATVGRAKLVSTGDPAHDPFTVTANSFRVYLPASWVRTADDERVVRRLLSSERPATTRYDLCLVEPRLRVATQATVGLDTIVGAVPSARLACRHDTDAPPSRPPRHRLGLDSVLARAEPRRPLRVGAGTRIGPGTGIR
jgi:phage tail-like protein